MIRLKSLREIESMRNAGRIVAEALALVRQEAKAGVTTGWLNEKVEDLIGARGGTPVFKGYRGFPKSICASINEEVVHGIPGERVLREGDVLSVDVGVRYQNYVADAALTIGIGAISPEAERLIQVTEEALQMAIAATRVGKKISDISGVIQRHAESHGYSVVRDYTGHGIGREMHEDPQVPNFVNSATLKADERIRRGMTLAIEPMIIAGGPKTKLLSNGWTVVAADGSLAAHSEHTVAVTDSEAVILTA
jgi:methionyl aminopeptidase